MNREKFKDFLEILPIVLTVIIGTFVLGIVSYKLIENRFPDSLLDLWNTWDAHHYINIAKYGYAALTENGKHLQIVFFPLFPLLIKLFSYVFQNYIVSALIVSNLAYAAAAYYLYKLVKLDFKKEDAYRAVIYFSVFPTAYFLHAAYTESLFLALTISSFYYARNDKWVLAGVLGMLAAATRITGIILLPVLIIEYLSQKEYKLREIKLDFLWIWIIALGLVSYLILNYTVSGDPFYFFEVHQTGWSRKLALPYEGLMNELGEEILGPEIIFAALGLAGAVYCFFRLRLSYSVYVLLTWFVVTSHTVWVSIPRYTLTMFPLIILMALIGRRRGINFMIIFFSLIFYALYLSQFVRFKWAF